MAQAPAQQQKAKPVDPMHEFLADTKPKPAPAPKNNHTRHETDMLDMNESTMMDFKDEVKYSEFQIDKKLGAGAFAEVTLGTWRGTPVAIKQLLPERVNPGTLADFKKEVKILSRLHHPNIMMAIASSVEPPHYFLVTEFCHQGTLFSLLHQSKTQFDTVRKLGIALDVARGLAYMHGFHPPIIHRDVKSLNVLVDKSFNCKVSDLGLAVSSFDPLTQKCGTYQYMAPELFSGTQPYNEKVDVFAFGIFLWELVSRQLPYSNMLGEQVPMAVERGHRPAIPDDCPPFFSKLMQECWDGNPHRRPNMVDVVNSLKQVSERMTDMWL
jgi:serine/threonine protein kinase